MTKMGWTEKNPREQLFAAVFLTSGATLDGFVVLFLIPSLFMVCVEVVLVLCAVGMWGLYFNSRRALKAESNQMNQKL